MSRKFTNIEGSELKDFVEKVKNNEEFQLIMTQLSDTNKIDSQEFKIVQAKKLESSDINTLFLDLSLMDDAVKIVATEINKKIKVSLRLLEEDKGTQLAVYYDIIDGRFVLTHKLNYEVILNGMDKLKDYTLPESLDRKEVSANLPCIYGNWCGPGCSGPSAPISPVDSCCKSHDNCYGSRGYFACSCDGELLNCLRPYKNQGSEWAILVYSYFWGSPCNPFK